MKNRSEVSTIEPSLPSGEAGTRLAGPEASFEQGQKELRTSRSKLRMALEVGKLGSWDRDLETNAFNANATCKAHLGLKPDDPLPFERLEEMYHPADAERVNQAIAYALATKTDFNIEHRIIRPDGRIGRVRVRGCGLYDDDKPVRIIGVTQDVSELEKMKEEIHLAQRRQEFLLDLNDRLRSLEDPHEIMEVTARSLALFLKVDCAGYGEIDEAREIILVEREWSKGAISNEGRHYPLRDFLPNMFAELKLGRSLSFDDVKTDPRMSDPAAQTTFSAMNARTALAVPLLKNDRLTALLYLNAAAPRAWSADEIALIEDATERTWIAVERARAEAAMRESEARFRVIAESLPALVWIIDKELRLTYANDRWRSFSGLPESESLGESWRRLIHPDDLARIDQDAQEALRTEAAYSSEMRYRAKDGTYRWHKVHAAPIRNAKGEFAGWCGTSVDIDDIKETEQALRTSEERLSLAQRVAKIGVFDWHVPSGHVTWSPEQEVLFGIPQGSFEGTYEGWATRVLPDGLEATTRNISEAMAHHDRDVNFSYQIRRPDGTLRSIQGMAMILYDEDGAAQRLIGVNLDITEHRQADERQQLLIRELHHRVKNTLATVQAIVGSTARTTASIDEFYHGFVGRIVSLARTHNLLTEDLWQKAALEDLVKTELGPYEDDARNRVVVEGPPVELPSEAAVPVGMAIHELTTNAAKHGALSTFGGTVEVKWRVESGGAAPMLHFSWTERGGPRVTAPSRQGFGTRLLQRVLTTQLQANVSMDFREDGMHFSMVMPIPDTPPIFNPDK